MAKRMDRAWDDIDDDDEDDEDESRGVEGAASAAAGAVDSLASRGGAIRITCSRTQPCGNGTPPGGVGGGAATAALATCSWSRTRVPLTHEIRSPTCSRPLLSAMPPVVKPAMCGAE